MQYDENAEKYGYEGEMTPLKCDELKAYKGDVYIPVYGSIDDAEVYLKKDVDAAIAELKDVIHELQVDLEGAKATAYAESVDAYFAEQLAEKDKEIALLKERICNGDVSRLTWIDDCIAKDEEIAELNKKLMPCLNGDCILTCEVVEKYGKENAELKAKLEDVQASMYCDVVDVNMENRRLKRALWLARAERAESRKNYWYARSCHEGDDFLVSIDGSPVKYIGCIKRTNYDWLLTWSEVESKCRAKAEEYR